MRLETEGELLGHYVYGNAEHRAVGGDEGKEDTQRLVERRADLLEHDLDHLHESRNHEDEGYGLQEGETERNEKVLVDQVSDKCRERNHEADCCGHSGRGGQLVGHTEERADSEELREDDIVDEYRRNNDEQNFHNYFLARNLLNNTIR